MLEIFIGLMVIVAYCLICLAVHRANPQWTYEEVFQFPFICLTGLLVLGLFLTVVGYLLYGIGWTVLQVLP